jgi:sterol desaturase/sphingolipid hydroxylase (fatty acid hydroxylase superfamily)
METNYQNEPPKMELLKETLQNLNETRKWTSFLAIMGFIFIGLMILIGFAMGSIFSSLGENAPGLPFAGSLVGFIYLIIALIYFFPVLYLYKFSSFTKKALINQNTADLNEAFRNLKSHYRFMGIITIVMMALYALIFLVAMIAGFAGLMA